MNNRVLFSLVGSILIALATTGAADVGNIGELDDRCSSHNYSEEGGWGVYPVKAGTTIGSNLDPRIERKPSPRIKPGDKMTFQATYNIVNADNSTFAQILNKDMGSSDKHKPVVFIIADDAGSQWEIRNKKKRLFSIDKNSGGKTPTFTLRVDTYYNESKSAAFSEIHIDGNLKEKVQHARVGQDAEMRYGNYHHGNGLAIIRVKNVSWQKTSDFKNSSSTIMDQSINSPITDSELFANVKATGSGYTISSATYPTQISITDMLGKTVWSRSQVMQPQFVDKTLFSNGVHIVRVKSGSQREQLYRAMAQ